MGMLLLLSWAWDPFVLKKLEADSKAEQNTSSKRKQVKKKLTDSNILGGHRENWESKL